MKSRMRSAFLHFSLKNSIMVSLLIHFFAVGFLLIGVNRRAEKRINIDMNRGSSSLPQLVMNQSPVGFGPEGSALMTNKQTNPGAIEEEVSRIRNKISYPALALEQGLEAECSWIVKINGEGMAGEISTETPCRFKIFENEFLKVIRDWKFKAPENTVIIIPVSFKIKRDSN